MGNERTPNEIDTYASFKIKEYRKAAGINQTKLGEEIGVSYQQMQKVESGKNRIAAGRLYKAAKVLGVCVNDFFPD